MMDENRTGGVSNGLGVAGFVLSIVGLCSGGLLSPIGLILSLVALGKPPRGFAVAGTVIGAIGSCGIIVSLLMIPVVVAMALAAVGLTAGALGVAALAGPQAEAQVEMFVLSTNIEQRAQEKGGLPASLDEFAARLSEAQLTDPWGHRYVYEPTQEGRAYRLYSKGKDGVAGTADDVQFTWQFDFERRKSRLDPSPPAPAPPHLPLPAEEEDKAPPDPPESAPS